LEGTLFAYCAFAEVQSLVAQQLAQQQQAGHMALLHRLMCVVMLQLAAQCALPSAPHLDLCETSCSASAIALEKAQDLQLLQAQHSNLAPFSSSSHQQPLPEASDDTAASTAAHSSSYKLA
jgi:hypothetical protein